ncbi:MAG: glutaredoxin family protein [Gammaproteobacteria bacterium]|nr:MAG: glutaredoxin family protein [Gammaproteobacteria bacterium]
MFCGMEKAWLSQKGVAFEERNITDDPSALEELVELGMLSTPITLIDGEVVVGFDQEKLSKLLEL